MKFNYNWILSEFNFQRKSPTEHHLRKRQKTNVPKPLMMLFMILFGIMNSNGQSTLINPTGDGGFNNGSSFTTNGWSVANEGTNPSKWVTGNASAMTGNAAYISNDGGLSNTCAGYNGNRTLYFYREVTVPAAEQAITLTFDVKSPNASNNGWQVWVAPTSQAIVGTDTQVTTAFKYDAAWSGATLISYNNAAQATTSNVTAFIPARFAGTTFKLIFAWTNTSSAFTTAPAAIDNISLTSRIPIAGQDEFGSDLVIQSAATGNWSSASTWIGGTVPTPADDVQIQGGHTVSIDCKFTGVHNLDVSGSNAILQWATNTTLDDFTVSNDLRVSGTGALFNVSDGTNGKRLKVAHDINLANSGRLDVSISNSSSTLYNGALELNGSTVQTVTAENASSFGGTVANITQSLNKKGVINQLIVTNTSTTTPNISWRVDGVRISSKLNLVSGRVGLSYVDTAHNNITINNKIIIGNYGACTEAYVLGNGFIGGTVSRWISSSYTTYAPAGVDFPWGVTNTYSFYQILDSNGNNRWTSIYPDAAPATSGEVAITYVDSNSITTGLSVTDDGYTINNRYGGNWTVATPDSNGSGTGAPIVFIPNTTTNTFRFAAYATGGYDAKDGSSHFMNFDTALGGIHQDGTTTPFVFRKNLTLSQLTTSPIYIGTGAASMVNKNTAIVSTKSGDWNATATWVGGIVPKDCDNVTIAAKHTVTITDERTAGNVTINTGGTLISSSGSLTVGCTGNNSVFNNMGTYTCNGGTLKVNGSVAHRVGSFFNHTGGDIIVDGNDNGKTATSVGFGGSIFKIETSNLNLIGGKITIVDPLVNDAPTAATATTVNTLTSNTAGASGTFDGTVKTAATINASTITMAPVNGGTTDFFAVNQFVFGTGIPTGTYITKTAFSGSDASNTITLSAPITAAIAKNTVLQFSSMSNGCNKIILKPSATNPGLAAGHAVSALSGIPADTFITSSLSDTTGGGAGAQYAITLSNNVTGLSTSPITSTQTLTFDPETPGTSGTVLTAADPNIQVGMLISGAGIAEGTIVTTIDGTTLKMSQPIKAGAPSFLSLTFSESNAAGAGAFIYDSPNHYAAGLNHTLQIGDGVSTQKGTNVSLGFNCIFQKFNVGGLLSLGNLIIDAPDGANRFMNAQTITGQSGASNINVQGDFTVASGSVFKKWGADSKIYIGGNLLNNGSFLTASNGITLYLGNSINGVAVATSLPQTISGNGTFASNLWAATAGPVNDIPTFQINNTNPAGVTLNIPFKPYGLNLTNGIIHTSATNLLIVGNPDMTATTTGSIAGGSPTSYVDGPLQYTFVPSFTDAIFKPFPVGKGTIYSPMTLAVSATGGAKFIAEAFTSNTGSAPSGYNLSTNRWKVTNTASTGFTSYNVTVGAVGLAAASAVVQAPDDQGAYDLISGTTPVYTSAPTTSPFGQSSPTPAISFMPSLSLSAAQAVATFTGNFAYVEGPSCTGTPAPGNTVASSVNVCSGQSTNLSLQNATVGTNVTYQWQSSTTGGAPYTDIAGAKAATYVATPSVTTTYICNVSCSGGAPVASNATTVTMANTDAPTVTPAAVCVAPANLSASGTGTLIWYDAATGGNIVTTGNTYAANATATYYVTSRSTSTSSNGQANLVLASSSAISTNFTGLAFNATRRFNLTSVKVYPKNTAVAPITIRLYNSAGVQVPGTSDVTFTPNTNTGNLDTKPQVVNLGYEVPAGTGYRLVAVSGLAAANTLAKSTATQPYPAPFNSLTITGNVTDLSSAVSTSANNYNYFFDIQVSDYCESARVPVTATVHGLPVVSAPSQVCVGSSITLSPATGGTWTSSDTTKATVTDAGVVTAIETGDVTFTFTNSTTTCSATTSTVTIKALPTVSASASQVCAGSSISLSPTTGGTWTSSDDTKATVTNAGVVSTIAAGDVTFTFTDATTGCSATTSTVTIKALPTVSAAPQVCMGSSITLSPTTGGTWISNDTAKATVTNAGVVTTIATGDVTFTFTDATTGCDATTSTVTINALPTVSAASQVCLGSSITLSPISGGTWVSNDTAKATVTNAGVVTTIATGDVTFTFTDSTTGCDATTSTVSIVALPEVNPITGVTSIDINQTVTLSSTTSGGTWSSDKTDVATVDALGNVTGVAAGEATISYTVTNNNCSASATTPVTVSSLSNSQFDISNLKYYPNPVTDVLTISYANEITSVTLHNLLGQEILNKTVNATSATLDLSNLPSGSYMIKINAEAMVKTIKVVKQ